MTNTIEVPISLINAGDIDAIRDLLPQENLFGRWAEHPTLGLGIIISEHPDQENFVKFVWESRNDYLTAKEMAVSGPWKILRYGWGE